MVNRPMRHAAKSARSSALFLLRLKPFGSNRSGVAAVEFAMILPFMLLIYFGGFEAAQALQMSWKVESTAETVGNLVTRNSTMTPNAINNIFNISSAIMTPYATNDLQIIVTAVSVDAKGKGTVSWSKANAGAPLAKGSSFTVPSEIFFGETSFFIQTDVSYAYHPALTYGGLFTGLTVKRSYAFRPRVSRTIDWSGS